ncbi:carboxypeptidase-like regulatory domain-containing protein [Galbibacter mesophilus]|uniref:carboxypeptidase-like regulatory domain-containing protein n=1 Tax=Galbibacter mesophilus TaxID=379069 RepID=UPI00191E849C|nr:carboxypeptidase-like regulatory domain-containing protein [Galbibacter mesophilus]MCM5662383.1 carboxypeptidase-like regulatory domain-containing protein [Galbibacter mesophilus]
MKHILIFTTFFFVFGNTVVAQRTIEGKVIDSETKKAIPYVNVGIENKNFGTISKEDGSFSLKIKSELIDENPTVVFSSLGYKTQKIPTHVIEESNIVSMSPEAIQLEEVIVDTRKKRWKKKKLGGYRTSIFNTGEANTDAYGVGKEYGLKIHHPGVDYRIEKVNFMLSENTIDSVLFRINMYTFSKENKLVKSILKEPLFVKSYKNDELISIDVSERKLEIEQDMVVAIEPVRLWYKSQEDNQLFYQQTKQKSTTFLRSSSASGWTKNELPPFAIFLDIKYYK